MPANKQISPRDSNYLADSVAPSPGKGEKGDKLTNYVNVLQQESAGAPPLETAPGMHPRNALGARDRAKPSRDGRQRGCSFLMSRLPIVEPLKTPSVIKVLFPSSSGHVSFYDVIILLLPPPLAAHGELPQVEVKCDFSVNLKLAKASVHTRTPLPHDTHTTHLQK
jgi:hypothetical protein